MIAIIHRALAAYVWCTLHPAYVEKLLELIILASFLW